MSRYSYERLSALDLSFLLAEGDNAPMHVGALAVLEAGPLGTDEGGVDIHAYRRAIDGVLHWIPRYRQKLAWTPVDRWAVWVDDAHFDLGYHVRHLSLPRPGTREQLLEMASRIFARRLDQKRPLWEIWVIEGLEQGEQFAVLNKTHHCMLDGAAGADLSTILFSPSPNAETPEPVPYLPRPEPTPLELFDHVVRERASQPLRAMRKLRAALADGEELGTLASRRAAALGELAGWSLRPSSDTPINGSLSPYRKLDSLVMPLEDVRELRRVLGCTVNDIVLATVSGALRRYLFRRRVDPEAIDFRVSAPVNVRREDDSTSKLGNQVSSWVVPLPLGEADPLKQVEAIGGLTQELKRSEASLGVETLMSVAEFLPSSLIEAGVGLSRGPINSIVTNVPGPQFPLYSSGARLLGLYPVVPLLEGCGLGIALFSYEGKLCWGFNADAELLPDLKAFVGDVAAAFETLRAAAVADFMERRTAEPEIDIPVQEVPKPIQAAAS